MRKHKIVGAAVAGVALGATALATGPVAVAAGPDPVQPVATGLSGPFGLDTFGGGFVVAESMSEQITWVQKDGDKRVLFDQAPVSGVTAGKVRVWSVTGEAHPEMTDEPQENLRALRRGPYPHSSVLKTHVKKGQTSVLADLLQYELEHNPDGQAQFDPITHEPYDALSNPFAITKYWKGLLVADGGANDVLLVKARSGKVSTFFVPPTVTAAEVPDCAGHQGPQGGVDGCDAVPTGVTVHGKSVYVSTLGGEVDGAGRIYQVNARNGAIQHVWEGLNSPTGVAVGPDGSIYYSQVFGPSEGPPGRIVRIAPNGDETSVEVPFPVGLTMKGGVLYATINALNDPGTGQIVRIDPSAFQAVVH